MQKRFFVCLVAPLLMALVGTGRAQTPVYQDPKAPLEARVQDVMERLTNDEKISLLAGTEFTTQPIPRLGIPPMVMADAGQGVRGGTDSTKGPATAFPSGVAMASTWNPALIGRLGAALGTEAQNKGSGVQLMLGPAVNIQRSPLGGRNGEYFSEDPFLAGRLAVGYIRGMQGTGTVACIKHFACNNEENDRFTVNVEVSERALREIYFPAFEAGVKEGGVWTVMSSYNRLNGPYASANHYLLTDVLKRGWGFDGMVMSDWGGVHEAARVINAGNDLEMPGRGFLAPEKVKEALARGRTTMDQINQNVTRIVRTILRSGVLDGPKTPNPALVNSEAARAVALQTAQEGIVLLKNERRTLPLDAAKIRSIALIGPAAREMQIGAAGSPRVDPLRSIGPLEGIQARAGANVQVRVASGDAPGSEFPEEVLSAPGAGGSGWSAEYFANKNLEGAPSVRRTDAQIDFQRPPSPLDPGAWSARWTTTLTPRKSGATTFFFRADDGCRLFLDGKAIIDHWQRSAPDVQSAVVSLQAGRPYQLRAEYFQDGGGAVAQLTWGEPGSKPGDAVTTLARQSDIALVCVTTRGTEGEGGDRPSLALPGDQDALIRRVAAANPRTIVVLNNGTPVSMPWLKSAPAVLEAWFPGQQGGDALASVLFGDVNPSGKLPDTLAVRREDYPDYGNYPEDANGVEHYSEGIYVGYRHFDKKKITPVFPFGYGLSYTTFRYSSIKLSSPSLKPNGRVTVTARITNTGRRAGAEIVELYVHPRNPKVDRAVRELKGYSKLELQPGETKPVTFTLTPAALQYCDVKDKGWKSDAGTYDVELAASSRDIRLTAPLRLTGNYFQPIPGMGATNPFVAPRSLTTGRPAIASSEKQGNLAKYATDGDPGTRWESDWSDPQWLAVDLGKPTKISRALLMWEKARAAAYRFQVSADGKAWTTVYSADATPSVYDAIRFAPVTARWVRVLGEKRNTEFGYSLYELNVYGK